MRAFKSLHFDFSLFSLLVVLQVDFSAKAFYSYKVLGRKYTNAVFWLL